MSLPDGFTRPPIWTFAKREGLLIAGEREFKGSRFFELRLWAGEGETPTGKGITMPCDKVAECAAALAAYASSLTSID
ncbi:transcriptional coactivator p15/PC4 family protein [Sphingopyxis sp. XHP0097]|uniref:Transcriptional coactivator p15/PC4 family protein n=1 Tax=Sphingopyxis jiangsuensis TaxID=2871171 RepID=A0ABS7MCT0_9SPHN|nr:PC4/YdbC family ssDNA-binding protein [Sphingopyxis jiangsuensis]MBY4636822.1 transcriptional coactivator p15/PC4 family protein [Sphingopyxis jiangsuensis]